MCAASCAPPPSPPSSSPHENSVPSSSVAPRSLLCHLRVCLSLNAVQRVLSAAVLAPLVTVFLWQSPAFATATVCSLIQSLCAYEFAWLAHRIQHRLLHAFHLGEKARSSQFRPTPSTATHSHSADHELAILQSDSRVSDATTPQQHPSSSSPLENSTISPLSLDDAPPLDTTHCAVSSLAARLPSWLLSSPSLREWFAAIAVSLLISALTTSLFLGVIVPNIPQLRATEFFASRVFYAVSTDFVGALCACLSPNARYAAVILLENLAFTVLTMYSTVCPINQFSCALRFEPAHVLLATVAMLLLLRFATSRSGSEATLLLALDVLGLLYIVGTLSVLVAFVDDDKRAVYRKLLIVLLYVTWASDTGAYVTGKLLTLLNYPCYHPLAPHLSKNKDYEGTFGAVLCGVAAMFLASHALQVGGDALAKVAFTVFGVVVGRVGDLFESLLKRAAGVKDSGSLIPGHGGVLDRIDALMFVTLVFARYYSTVLGGGKGGGGA